MNTKIQIKLNTKSPKSLSQKDKHLTCVGDFSQAIYSWRGADYKNMLMLKSDFPDLTTINLEQNYRSTQNILDAANLVVSRIPTTPFCRCGQTGMLDQK